MMVSSGSAEDELLMSKVYSCGINDFSVKAILILCAKSSTCFHVWFVLMMIMTIVFKGCCSQ